MKKPIRSDVTWRLFKVVAATFAVAFIALAPAFLASILLTQRTVEHDEANGSAATIDVTDIDQNGTVMYTVSPPQDAPADFEFDIPSGLVEDADLIRLTISDKSSDSGLPEDLTADECKFTFYLSDSDEYDEKTSTYIGYLRINDDELGPHYFHPDDDGCSIVITYTDE